MLYYIAYNLGLQFSILYFTFMFSLNSVADLANSTPVMWFCVCDLCFLLGPNECCSWFAGRMDIFGGITDHCVGTRKTLYVLCMLMLTMLRALDTSSLSTLPGFRAKPR